jgi:hypothetical protein
MRTWVVILLVLPWTLLTSCGWKRRLSLPSPSGKYRLEFYQPRVINEADLRIDLAGEGDSDRTIYSVGHEMFLQFAHAYWSPDERVVAVLACGSDVFRFAYDRTERRFIPFEGVQEEVKRDLARAYPAQIGVVSLRLDPPHSPCLERSLDEEFLRRYPQ